MCGQHAVNNLLQGQFFDVSMLGDIASGLDAEERALMMEGGSDSADALRFLAADSQNVDDSGNFSIQVLRRALSLNGVELVESIRPEHREQMLRPHELGAFVCNLDSHWFAVRKVHGEWWDLNSLLDRPRWLSPTYLGAYIGQLRMQAYDIFIARSARGLPLPVPAASTGLDMSRYFSVASLRTPAASAAGGASAAPAAHDWGSGQRLDGGGVGAPSTHGAGGGTGGSDAELARVLALSAQEWASSQGEGAGGGGMEEDEDEDSGGELARALALSVASDAPPAPAAAAPAAVAPPALPTSADELAALPSVKVDFCGEGAALVCAFLPTWTVAQLVASIRDAAACPASVRRCARPRLLLVVGPRALALGNRDAALADAGVRDRARLRLEIG